MATQIPIELSRLLEAPDPAAREQAWDAFASHHSRLLLHTARSIGGNYDAAMDAYAYILEALRQDDCRRLRAYVPDSRSRFTTWLVVVARRLCLDHHRQQYGRARDANPGLLEERATRRRLVDLLAERVDPEQLSQPNPEDPGAGLESRERSEALASSVAALEPRDRLLLRLRFEDDLSAREIATIMQFATAFHVYRRLTAVLASLQRALRRQGVDEAGA